MIKCPKCAKEFKSEVALRMHDMRTHTGVIKTPGQLAVAAGKRFKQPWTGGSSKWSQDQLDLLKAIDDKYRDTFTGQISWERAFAEHPEWEADLGNRNRTTLTQKLAYIKKVGKHSKPKKRSSGGRWNDDQLRLLLEIEANYKDRTNGNISWKRAFEDHPDWLEKLDNRDTFTLSGKISYLREYPRPDLAPAAAPTQAIQVRPRKQQPVAAPVVPEQNGHGHVLFCPHCGENILHWNQISELVRNVKQLTK